MAAFSPSVIMCITSLICLNLGLAKNENFARTSNGKPLGSHKVHELFDLCLSKYFNFECLHAQINQKNTSKFTYFLTSH